MSIYLMTEAFKTAIPTTQKFVFVSLCDNANDQGECYPSVQMICQKTSLKERAVRAACKWLVEHGFMVAEHRKGSSNYFYIAPPETWNYEPEVVHNPCTKCTPASNAPLHEMQDTPASNAPPPLHNMHPTPARGAPITIIEPSIEPSRNHQRGRATRLPADWQPSVQDENYCKSRRPDLNVQEVAERFRNYWHAKSGRDATKLDWSATWRNWVLNERQHYRPHQQRSTYEQTMEVAQRAKAMIFGESYAEN